jgi:hypothetical protein
MSSSWLFSFQGIAYAQAASHSILMEAVKPVSAAKVAAVFSGDSAP